jgi:DNA polymerase-4
MENIILHCDMNNFFASVECLYNPEIRDFPVAVCGSVENRHGIVLAKNNIAKKTGVKTGEPIWQAKNKCPDLITVEPHFDKYLKFSKLARNIYSQYTDRIEAFGIDENWLDVTHCVSDLNAGEKLAYTIKERIKAEMGVTISIGVSFNKIFAKLGSDLKKPDAVTVISKNSFKAQVWPLPVEELLFVGHSTTLKLNKAGIFIIGDLANCPQDFISDYLGKWGSILHNYANGLDNSPVNNIDYSPQAKGIGNSNTPSKDICCDNDAKILIYTLSESIAHRLKAQNLKGKTVQITIKDTDLQSIDRQMPFDNYTYTSSDIAKKAYELFRKSWDWHKNVRLLGVRVTDLVSSDGSIQLSMFDDNKKELLDISIDNIRSRFGKCCVQRGIMLTDKAFAAGPEPCSLGKH